MDKPKTSLLNKNLILHFSKASEISYALYKLIKKPNIGSAAGFLSILGKTSIETFGSDVLKDWIWQPIPNSIVSFISDTIIKKHGKYVGTVDQSGSIYSLYKFLDIYFVLEDKQGTSETIVMSVHKTDVDIVNKNLSEFLWKNSNLLLEITHVKDYGFYNVAINNDDLYDPLPTKLGQEIYEDCKKYYAFNEHRAIMLVGRPGTGKSSMARFVSEKLKMRTLRICAEVLSNIRTPEISKILDFLNPKIIIIDDLDKVELEQSSLELFQSMKKKAEFIFITSNYLENFEDSLLRAGRIDDIIIVESIDDDIIKQLLGNNKELFDQVKTWPVSFINDLKIRIKVLGKERAIKSIEELNKRVEMLSNTEGNESTYKNTSNKKIKDFIIFNKKVLNG